MMRSSVSSVIELSFSCYLSLFWGLIIRTRIFLQVIHIGLHWSYLRPKRVSYITVFKTMHMWIDAGLFRNAYERLLRLYQVGRIATNTVNTMFVCVAKEASIDPHVHCFEDCDIRDTLGTEVTPLHPGANKL